MKDKSVRKILISRTDKIGDLVLSIPSIVMAGKMYPEAEIYVLVRKYNAPVVQGMEFIREVIIYDDYSLKDLGKKLKDIGIDTFVALYSNFDICRLSKLSGAKRRIGPLSKIYSWFFYNCGIKQSRSKSIKNEAEYNLDLIRQIDSSLFDSLDISFSKIKYGKKEKEEVEKFLSDNKVKKPFILVNPFSGGSAKNFTVDEYVLLIKELKKRLPETDIIISSSVNDKKESDYIVSKVNGLKQFVCSDLKLLVSFIDSCELYIGGSTGPSHIAGNLGKKCVCIYPLKASMSHIRWGLFGNDDRTVYINPDKNNSSEDYKKSYFDNVTCDIIEETAEKVKVLFNERKS